MGTNKGKIVRTAWIEKPLSGRDDGTLGVADMLNTLMAGGVVPLEFRVLHIEGTAWVLLAKVGEREPVAEKKV